MRIAAAGGELTELSNVSFCRTTRITGAAGIGWEADQKSAFFRFTTFQPDLLASVAQPERPKE